MPSFSQKVLIAVAAVAIVWIGVWNIQRKSIPENPDDIRVDPEVGAEVRALLEKSKTANLAERMTILYDIRGMGFVAVPPVVCALRDPDPRVRAFAANILQHSNNTSVIPHLEARLIDEDSIVRRTALAALGQLGAVDTVPAIIVVLNDKDRFTRCQAALVLGTLGQKSAVMPLIDILEYDPYSVARRTAANSLGEIGDERAVPSLVRSLKDENHIVRSASLVALNRITDGDFLEDKSGRPE